MTHFTRRTRRRYAPLGLMLFLATGCGGYGRISPTAYEYSKALYSISNRQAAAALDQVSEQIVTAREAGELSDAEAGWLGDMIDDARAGDWQAANSAARRMMEDQVL